MFNKKERRNKMTTFIYEGKKYKFKTMEEANKELPLGHGRWDERSGGCYSCAHNGNYITTQKHHAWVKGNFFD
jgi:hypothetical protein